MVFALNFNISNLFRKFEICRKLVQNHGLTPLLLGEIFRPQNYLKYYCKVAEIRAKLCYSAKTFIFRANFESLKLVEKSSKTVGQKPFTFYRYFSISKFRHNFTLN